MTAGYSGKPLAAKLDLKPGHRVLLVGAPAGFEATLGTLPDGTGVSRRLRGGIDVAHLFATSRAVVATEAPKLQARIADGGHLWVSWPKRSSGVATDVTEDALRELLIPTGWVDTKVCAVDDTWSGLKFMRRVRPSDKPGRPTAAEVEVPSELRKALASDRAAKAAYEAMPPSHRREYARWVGEAKTPETRERRARETLERLNVRLRG